MPFVEKLLSAIILNTATWHKNHVAVNVFAEYKGYITGGYVVSTALAQTEWLFVKFKITVLNLG